MRLRPGGFLWLMSHDLRLGWRGVAGMVAGVRAATLVPLLVLAVLFVHLFAWPIVQVLDPYLHGRGVGISSLVAIIGATFTWMLAQGIFGLTRALYQRADLDLLLGSPLPSGRVIAAKAAAIATGSFGSVAILALPIAHTGALVEGSHWLGIYPLLLAFALLATAVGLALVVGLFLMAGARRARLLAHLVAAGVAGTFVLGAQVVAMLPAAWRESIASWVDGLIDEQAAGIGALLWVPVATAQGDPLGAFLMISLAVLIFGCVVGGLGTRFAAASSAAAGAEAGEIGRASRRERVSA
jgi:ABC-2 type transport system permease protein